MELIRGPRNVRERHRGAIVTLGSFDGLHLGHQALIRAALERALDVQLLDGPAFDDGHPGFLWGPVDENVVHGGYGIGKRRACRNSKRVSNRGRPMMPL